jgi:hypothetical protein
MDGALVGAGSLWPGFSGYEECDGIASLINYSMPIPTELLQTPSCLHCTVQGNSQELEESRTPHFLMTTKHSFINLSVCLRVCPGVILVIIRLLQKQANSSFIWLMFRIYAPGKWTCIWGRNVELEMGLQNRSVKWACLVVCKWAFTGLSWCVGIHWSQLKWIFSSRPIVDSFFL